MNIRKAAGAFAAGGLVLGLLGSGIGASYLDSATAALNINVGTFQCQLSSTDSHAVISSDLHTVTFTLPAITSSTAGSSYVQDLTLKNAGSIPAAVHWTFAYAGTVVWQPNSVAGHGSFGFAVGTGNAGDPTRMDTDFTLAAGASKTYGAGGNGVGFQWTTLGNLDFGATASVTATVNCGEVPPPPVSKISFVGANSMVIGTPPSTSGGPTYMWIGMPTNNQPLWGGAAVGAGVLTATSTAAFAATGPWVLSVTTTLVAGGSPATVSCTGKTATSFTGCTTISGGGMLNGATISAAKATLAMPTFAVGDIAIVETEGLNSSAVPAGYTDLGVAPYNSRFSYKILTAGDTVVPSQAVAWTDELVAVYRNVAGIGAHTTNGGFVNNVGGASYPLNCSGLTLTTPTGAAWVACMGYDGYATTNAKSMVFDSNTTNRSASLADAHVGLADTNAGVAAWSNVGWTGDNFPLPGSHAVTVMSMELLSK